jgi:hypothetical protein
MASTLEVTRTALYEAKGPATNVNGSKSTVHAGPLAAERVPTQQAPGPPSKGQSWSRQGVVRTAEEKGKWPANVSGSKATVRAGPLIAQQVTTQQAPAPSNMNMPWSEVAAGHAQDKGNASGIKTLGPLLKWAVDGASTSRTQTSSKH